MNCPFCHAPGAYVGALMVECRNQECEKFTLKQFYLEEPPSEPEDEGDRRHCASGDTCNHCGKCEGEPPF